MSGLILYTSGDAQSRIQLRAAGKRHQTPSEKFRLLRRAIIKQSLTVQTVAKPRATAEDSSVHQTVDSGQALSCVKVLDQGPVQQWLPSSVGN